MNKKLSTFEGIARIINFTDNNVIEANRFSQEIITDGILTKKDEHKVSSFAEENKEYLKKVSEASKRCAYELIKYDYDVENANYIIKIYYENLRYIDYFGEIRDVDLFIEDINDKEILKKVKDILNYRFKVNKSKYYINKELLSKVVDEPVKFIREKVKNQ